jgi:hypothetical protein
MAWQLALHHSTRRHWQLPKPKATGQHCRLTPTSKQPTGNTRTHFTWPEFQARLPAFGKLVAELGVDEVELRLGDYLGIANQQA